MHVLLFGRPMAGRVMLSPVASSSPRPGPSPVIPPLEPGRIERWAPVGLRLDPWTVLRLARYRRRADVAPAIWETARRMTARALALVQPEAALVPVRVQATGTAGVRLAGGAAFSGRAIGRLLAGCPQAI